MIGLLNIQFSYKLFHGQLVKKKNTNLNVIVVEKSTFRKQRNVLQLSSVWEKLIDSIRVVTAEVILPRRKDDSRMLLM